MVTGGAGRIGEALVRTFMEAGMNVVIADVDLERAQALASTLTGGEVKALAVETDVSDLSSVTELAAKAIDEFGAVHLLCNNAGRILHRSVEELTAADWDRVISSHLGGVINGLLAFLPGMMDASGDRHIVNTASMAGVGLGSLRATGIPYVTAKFAITGMTEALAPALAPHGIGASVLCPGLVRAEANPVAGPSVAAKLYGDEILHPMKVASLTLDAIKTNRVHIFTHRASVWEVVERHRLLLGDLGVISPVGELAGP